MLITNRKIAALALFVAASAAPQLLAATTVSAQPVQVMAESLSDPEIAGIVSAFEAKELAASDLAIKNATDPQLVRFADGLVKEHTRIHTEFVGLVRRIGVKEQDSTASLNLRADQARSLQKLQGLTGADFDKEYLQEMITDHQSFGTMMDQTLIPSATIADMKSYLQALRGDIQKYFDEAVALKPVVGI